MTSESPGTSAGSGEQRRRSGGVPTIHRIGYWSIWWTLLMALWIYVDDTIDLAELLSGAAVAVIAATFVELVFYQSDSRIRIKIEWLQPALKLPGALVKETLVVLDALWRLFLHGVEPSSGYRVLPVEYGDDTPEGVGRRALLIGGRSVAPNTFAVGLDKDSEVLVVHQLRIDQGAPIDSGPNSRQGDRR
ncbi:MAG: hypothetical protein ACRDVP_09955 [Acidimicrobiales bacterium]